MKAGFPLFNKLHNILEKVVPQDEKDFNRIKENRLFISMSKLENNGKKTAHKVSKFNSRRHQILCNLASSFIDVFGYMGNNVQPVEIEPNSGVRYVDGFYTDQLPLFPGKNVWTMTVSPFAAEAVIHPHDKIMKYVFQLNVFRIYINKENLDRLGNAIVPTIANLMAYRKQGFRDALKFLAENDFTDTKGIKEDQYEQLVNEHIQEIAGH
ncbi:patatin-like phospholipase domain-containing protein 2 [Ditylenchus destructor]|uniref:Patatin-like phospholipase domain-containing protein 2 n=1 Tax=Ditylenchus destructor TaxID=166010 RepID=A0AAD4MJQ8_9BILA|nr:patatin-like phospholipase domain-containing protein 2 [Ditylenchus destructor]